MHQSMCDEKYTKHDSQHDYRLLSLNRSSLPSALAGIAIAVSPASMIVGLNLPFAIAFSCHYIR
jgi:hypothetical protein